MKKMYDLIGFREEQQSHPLFGLLFFVALVGVVALAFAVVHDKKTAMSFVQIRKMIAV